MDRRLLQQKKKILQRISEKTYQDLLEFVGKIYLAEFDLKILMARKCSNLFNALLPFSAQEEGGRRQRMYAEKFQERKEPVIISNRALALVKDKITSGEYRRILLADDIIIHGRTLDRMYRLIQSWFDEAGISDYEIRVYAYVESDDGLLENMIFSKTREVCHKYSTGKWRAVSNMIVDIFYLLGVSYTSYVPNAKINKESILGRRIEEKLADGNSLFLRQNSADMQRNDVRGYVYIEESKNIPDFAVSCNIRIYEYSGEYVLVPMVMLNPLENSVLGECLNAVRKLIDDDLWEMLERVREDDIRYRVLVYVLSALFGWRFTESVLGTSAANLEYELQEELMNFSHAVLVEDIVSKYTAEMQDRLWRDVNTAYKPVLNLDELTEDEEDFNKLEEIFRKNIQEFRENGQDYKDENSQMLVGKFLYLNGRLDDERCQNIEEKSSVVHEAGIEEMKRLIGFPIYRFAKNLGGLNRNIIKAVLYAIDFGKGSIVSKKLEKEEGVYFLSVIHAGEQNYKYYENEYFPFLYGLYHLERVAERKGKAESLPGWKKKFMNLFKRYWRNEKHFFLDDDLKRVEGMDVAKDYGEVILNTDWKQLSDPDVDKARQLVKKMTNG